jgi:acyl-CoA reductase-like NAD-dependent aldehyde dehydrogenase
VVTPSNPADGYWMLRQAISSDDPIVFLEPKSRYWMKDAVDRGATLRIGGSKIEGEGTFFEPTVLTNVDHSMKIMREETFGPTLPIMKIADVEEGVALANDSPYGLQASVWTRDTPQGEQIARRLEVGAVCVNAAQINYFALNMPMGGWKASGISSRHGVGGIRKYCRQQAMLVSGFGPRKELFMFPYSAGVTRQLQRLYRAVYGRGRGGN